MLASLQMSVTLGGKVLDRIIWNILTVLLVSCDQTFELQEPELHIHFTR